METILELELKKQHLQALLLMAEDFKSLESLKEEIEQIEEQIYLLKIQDLDDVDFIENY